MTRLCSGHGAAPPSAEPSRNIGLLTNLYSETSAILSNALDEARLRDLRAEAAGMDDDQVVSIALDTIDSLQN
jgi:hypothetical protein